MRIIHIGDAIYNLKHLISIELTTQHMETYVNGIDMFEHNIVFTFTGGIKEIIGIDSCSFLNIGNALRLYNKEQMVVHNKNMLYKVREIYDQVISDIVYKNIVIVKRDI